MLSTHFGRALAGTLFLAVCSLADEGIWLPNHFPKEKIQKRYGVQVTDAFLERLQRASVRVGASGSFVSPRGLILTNHHVASECIQQLSTKEHDYMANGFYAPSEADERRCPDLEAQVLQRIDDVTAQVNEGIPPETPAAEANRRRKANMARIEKECTERTGLRCEVVTLYSGGWYHLYEYKKYDDVRLVFAPETDIAFFGGDPDNFTYPRYCLDVAFLRAYEGGRPADTPNYLRWSRGGVKEGELVFVSGHPASTGRLATYAQLEFFRDVSYPLLHRRLESLIRTLEAYSAASPENKRVARDNLFSQQNSYKAYTGFLRGLRDPKLIINRIRPKMVRQGDMMSIEDMIDILAIDLLGVIPEDEMIVITTNKGEPVVLDQNSRSGQAYRNITRRVLGEDVPMMNLEEEGGFFKKLRKIIGLK
ncbi:MAG: S46 family peptidase [Bryobacteraceae bacterium]|nr:S46 family peptidase [Bryobacteraceae bacterium]